MSDFDCVNIERLVAEGKKIIGWGTSSIFEEHYSDNPSHIAYLVDNNPDCAGKKKFNLEIKSPDAIMDEDQANTIIVIFSSSSEEIEDINEQIKTMGPFIVVDANKLLSNKVSMAYDKIKTFVAANKSLPRAANSNNAIVIQGPLHEEITQEIVLFYAIQYPQDFIILSTWSDSDPNLLDEIKPYIDELVLSDLPSNRGPQNRNLQQISTHAGLLKAKELGASFALKNRTDMLISAPDIFHLCRKMISTWDDDAPKAFGQKGRIIIIPSYTQKFIPYFFSDFLSAGDVDDLLSYWSAPPDNRTFDTDNIFKSYSFRKLGEEGFIAEAYFASTFAKRIGWEVKGTIKDSWELLRNFFIVADVNCLGLLWYKHPNRNLDEIDSYSWIQYVTHDFWQALYFGKPAALEERKWAESQGLDRHEISFKNMYGGKKSISAKIKKSLRRIFGKSV